MLLKKAAICMDLEAPLQKPEIIGNKMDNKAMYRTQKQNEMNRNKDRTLENPLTKQIRIQSFTATWHRLMGSDQCLEQIALCYNILKHFTLTKHYLM